MAADDEAVASSSSICGHVPRSGKARSVQPYRTDHQAHDLGAELTRAQLMLMLPGAWAMGDGVLTEVDVPGISSFASEFSSRPSLSSSTLTSASSTWTEDAEQLSQSLILLASSFTTSVTGYFSDLALALSADAQPLSLVNEDGDVMLEPSGLSAECCSDSMAWLPTTGTARARVAPTGGGGGAGGGASGGVGGSGAAGCKGPTGGSKKDA